MSADPQTAALPAQAATGPTRRLRILGCRGVPAAHSGFEYCAEYLALYLVQRGWAVTVYCQAEGQGGPTVDTWRGIERVSLPVESEGPWGTIVFDWKSTRHAAAAARKDGSVVLTLGYNTAVFSALYRLSGVRNLFNMDGIEWRRGKWRRHERAWFYLNDWLGCWLGNHLIADHPEIKRHLATRVKPSKITVIPYGAEQVLQADPAPLAPLGLEPNQFLLVIARPEPENQILQIVRAFSRQPRGVKLVVLGKYRTNTNAYRQSVLDAAGSDVVFPGAIFDKPIIHALRRHARLYIHGHTVGGTNPSLVEALGAGSAVLAHDNPFNRWVAGPDARYFHSENDLGSTFDTLLGDEPALEQMRAGSRARFCEQFTWDRVLGEYEQLLEAWCPSARAAVLT